MHVVTVNLVSFVYVFFYVLQLKKELHSEIVKDVTRKTVKHVLRGLDGAVLQSYKGEEAIDTQPKGVSATPAEDTERNAESSSHHRKLSGVLL